LNESKTNEFPDEVRKVLAEKKVNHQFSEAELKLFKKAVLALQNYENENGYWYQRVADYMGGERHMYQIGALCCNIRINKTPIIAKKMGPKVVRIVTEK
jgi:hypothetical protein